MYELVKNNDIEDITKRVLALINGVSQIMNSGKELEETRMELARLMVVVGEFEARAEYEQNSLDVQRKVQEAQAFANAKRTVGKISIAEANNYAEIEVSEIKKKIVEAQYMYRQLRNLREAIVETNNAIAMRVRTLEREFQDTRS
ncbi:MAG TPA: hypothetical protein PLD76_04505 [Paludibacteraceae bacterium]|nr:hypothetical protein [Paludibacteraceae bacterium]